MSRRQGRCLQRGLLWASVALAIAVSACARPPRPPALAQADSTQKAPATKEARRLAPQATAHADSLREQAIAAYDRDDVAVAAVLAERAVVAYERASVLARVVRAVKTAEVARRELASSQKKLVTLEAERKRVSADLESVEHLIKVIKDAEPLVPAGRGDQAREAARFKAARAVTTDARLLCVAAKLLGRPLGDLAKAEAAVQSLEKALDAHPRPVPIDKARRLRTRCLSLLTKARRSSAHPPASGLGDLVLSELSGQANLAPYRDDRGVVVILRGDPLSKEAAATKRLAALVKTAAKHKDYPILVVAHTSSRPSSKDTERASARARDMVKALEGAGITRNRLKSELAGGARPVVREPGRPPPNSRNERLEVIFVTPGT